MQDHAYLIQTLRKPSQEILFGKLVHGGKAIVDINNNNEIQINYESKPSSKLYYRNKLYKLTCEDIDRNDIILINNDSLWESS